MFFFILSLIQYIVYQLFPDPEIKGKGGGGGLKKVFFGISGLSLG